jgi:hypothetical protein
MKPYRRAHDIDDPELRDYFVWDPTPTRSVGPRTIVCLLAALVFALGFAAYVFAQDGGEYPTGQPASSIGRIYPLMKGTAGTDEDGYHRIALKDVATTRWTHVCVLSRLTYHRKQADHDVHLKLEDGGAFIIGEIVEQIPLPVPRTGTRIEVCGITRYDRLHNWAEIHPVLRIRVLTKGTP